MWGQGLFTAADQLCEDGLEEWLPAAVVMSRVEMGLGGLVTQSRPVGIAYRKRKDLHPWLMSFFILAGVVSLPFGLFVAAILFAVAWALSGEIWRCSACGKAIQREARFCPACHAGFKRAPSVGWKTTALLVAALVTLALGLYYMGPRR